MNESQPPSRSPKVRGLFLQRLFLWSMVVFLGLLFYWLFGFAMHDLYKIPGPDYDHVERMVIDQDLLKKEGDLQARIKEGTSRIARLQKRKTLLKDSITNLQQTINQLQAMTMQESDKDRSWDEVFDRETVNESLSAFLNNQREYQDLNEQIAEAQNTSNELQRELESVQQQLNTQRDKAREEYREKQHDHRMMISFFQLVFALAVFAASVFVAYRWRRHTYSKIFVALAAASFVRMVQVAHRFFPAFFFKYLALIALIVASVYLVIYLVRQIAQPRKDLVMRKFKEGYERFVCPVCEFPMRLGPIRFGMFKRGRKFYGVAPEKCECFVEEAYTCPNCGTELFEECANCGRIRHSLLEYCNHCGGEVDVQC